MSNHGFIVRRAETRLTKYEVAHSGQHAGVPLLGATLRVVGHLMPPFEGKSNRIARFGVFELDLNAGELRKNGAKLRLQEQPFQVLTLLLERAGDVVTREELRQKLWPADTS